MYRGHVRRHATVTVVAFARDYSNNLIAQKAYSWPSQEDGERRLIFKYTDVCTLCFS